MFDLIAATTREQQRRENAPAAFSRCGQLAIAAHTLNQPAARPAQEAAGPIPLAPANFPGVVFVDIETYFDRDYNLDKLSLPEYIRDDRFAVLGIGLSYHGQRHWLSGEAFRAMAAQMAWANLTVAAHNTAFDGAILAWHFGIRPGRWADTLSMAKGSHPQLPDYSLAGLSTRFGLGKKLDTLDSLCGIANPDATQMTALRQYNDTDLALLERLWAKLQPHYPETEMALIDMTIRQCVEPRLILDPHILQQQLSADQAERTAVLEAAGLPVEVLRSAERFADALRTLGIDPPQKISASTGKASYAFSIKDPAFLALVEHPDPAVRNLIKARLNAMSNITTSRAERMARLAATGALPVELNYYGAATGRFSGGGGVNLQNLPHDSMLRHAITAPPGHLLVGCDSAQIEARVLAWLAGQTDLVEAFRDGIDVYCQFASTFFGREITKADAAERKVGKTAILGLGYGMGAKKFADNLKTSGVSMADADVNRLVDIYRKTYAAIPALWRAAEQAVMQGGKGFGKLGLALRQERIHLPNGLSLHYPGLRQEPEGQWRYDGRRGRDTLYGGKIVENVVQALARIVVMEQQLAIAQRFPVVFSVHDEIVCCVPEAEAETCRRALIDAMSTAPTWAPGLPIACEAAVGRSYGDL